MADSKPNTDTPKIPQYSMDSEEFTKIWKEAITNDHDWDWFLDSCFDKFSQENELHLAAVDSDWAGWTPEQWREHTNKKCYAKSANIIKKIKKKYPEASKTLKLPKDYKKSTATTSKTADLWDILK
tara:strand:- start:1146 stop:1523 length:378 start_codon:yes stop_codon:yes gene_type:complete